MKNDSEIIELFFARSEQAITELDRKYGAACHRLARSILGEPRDAEECVSDAYLGTWNAIPPQRPNPLLTFVCKIVRNLSIKRCHANSAAKRNSAYDVALEELEGCLASHESVEGIMEAKELTGMIEDFLASLSRENRVIFMRRYWFSDTYAQISKQLGLTEKNVSVRLTRMRKQLRGFLAQRGVAV